MTTQVVSIILLVIVTAYFAVKTYFNVKGKSKEAILKELKQEAYKLFLYAQKQGWTGPEKMEWCAKKIALLFPEQIRTYIEGPIQEWLQSQYDDFKKFITDNAASLETKTE
jgi:hypothetical protein